MRNRYLSTLTLLAIVAVLVLSACADTNKAGGAIARPKAATTGCPAIAYECGSQGKVDCIDPATNCPSCCDKPAAPAEETPSAPAQTQPSTGAAPEETGTTETPTAPATDKYGCTAEESKACADSCPEYATCMCANGQCWKAL